MCAYLMAELFAPRTEQNHEAILRFYTALGWRSFSDSEDYHLVYTMPNVNCCPFIAYWLTTNQETCSAFRPTTTPDDAGLFVNSHRLAAPPAFEPVLVIDSAATIMQIWAAAQSVLTGQNTTVNPGRYKNKYPRAAGFRFRDPFGHRIRVTTDPGYEATSTPTTNHFIV